MLRISTMVITGARQEFNPFIRETIARLLPPEEGFYFVHQRGAEEALARADRLMPPQEQFAIRDILHTKSQLARNGGVTRCVLVGSVACLRGRDGFEECERLVRRERFEVSEWHVFTDVRAACLTPEPEIVLLC